MNRDAFEKWAQEQYGSLKFERTENGEYFAYSLNMAWKGWQASRAQALEEVAEMCELWNTTPGGILAKSIRALAQGGVK